MYPSERDMKALKDYVRNHYYHESCIAKRYFTEEALEFCAEYLSNCDAIELSTSFQIDFSIERPLGSANIKVVNDLLLAQAHRCVLMNIVKI